LPLKPQIALALTTIPISLEIPIAKRYDEPKYCVVVTSYIAQAIISKKNRVKVKSTHFFDFSTIIDSSHALCLKISLDISTNYIIIYIPSNSSCKINAAFDDSRALCQLYISGGKEVV
jgi:hypothetical protein